MTPVGFEPAISGGERPQTDTLDRAATGTGLEINDTSKLRQDAYNLWNSNENLVLNQQSNPITGLERPRGFQEGEAPRFQDSRHMNVVRLSAVRTGPLYPPGNIPGAHFC